MGATGAIIGALAPLVGTGLSAIMGAGQNREPDIPDFQATQAPTYEQEGEPEQKAARDEQRRRIRSQRAGMNGTLLSRPLAQNTSGLLGSSLTE